MAQPIQAPLGTPTAQAAPTVWAAPVWAVRAVQAVWAAQARANKSPPTHIPLIPGRSYPAAIITDFRSQQRALPAKEASFLAAVHAQEAGPDKRTGKPPVLNWYGLPLHPSWGAS